MRRAILRDPTRMAYMDEALAPVADDEEERLEMFTGHVRPSCTPARSPP
jgi:hypothetical protein